MFAIIESIEYGRIDSETGVRPEVKVPVMINTDQIQYIRQSDDNPEQCIVQFAGGFPIFIEGSFKDALAELNILKGE